MVSFRFLDETYFPTKQTYKSLAIRNLYAEMNLDNTVIGQIQCYYLNAHLLDFENLDLTRIYLKSLDKESLDLYNEYGFYDEENYDRFSEENFIYEDDYGDFLYNNNIEEVHEYIKNKNDILFIKEIKLNKPYDFKLIIKDLKYTIYIMFDYKNFTVVI